MLIPFKNRPMKKPKRIFSLMLLTCPNNLFIPVIFICFMFTPIVGHAQNPQASQWASVGGKKLLSGNHNFTETWTSTAYSREKGLYWQGGFYDPEDKRNYQPWENTVKKSVAPEKGQVVVLGPCNVGLYQKAKGARMQLVDHNTNKGFTAWTNTVSWSGSSWSGTIKVFNEKGEFWGYVPAGVEVTIDVSAVMTAYNNAINTGEYAFRAPQEIEFEIWFFPRGDGCQVKKATKICEDGTVLDVTNGDIPCQGGNSKCSELKNNLTMFIDARKATIKSLSDYQKQIDALNQHSPYNTGYLNEYQNNTLGNDPVWNKKNLQILQSGAGGGGASYLYNKDKWKAQLNKSIELQTLNLEKINWEITKIEEQITQLGCK